MSTNSINGLGSSYLQSVLATAVQRAGQSTFSSASGSGVQAQSDQSQLSPFAQMMNTLQQLQQSNPTEYKQVTAQIATSLQTAAKTATADGNTSAATQLNQLATTFSNASTDGQPLKMQDVAKRIGGHGHHGHHHSSSSTSDSSSTSSTTSTAAASSTSASTAASPFGQLLAALQSSGSQNEALNPVSIISNALTSSKA